MSKNENEERQPAVGDEVEILDSSYEGSTGHVVAISGKLALVWTPQIFDFEGYVPTSIPTLPLMQCPLTKIRVLK